MCVCVCVCVCKRKGSIKSLWGSTQEILRVMKRCLKRLPFGKITAKSVYVAVRKVCEVK